jgi:hypothetical protein
MEWWTESFDLSSRGMTAELAHGGVPRRKVDRRVLPRGFEKCREGHETTCGIYFEAATTKTEGMIPPT